jgi:F-type H+-transporting ATPase subunit epsilon
MPKVYPFEVHTPYRLFYSGEVEEITLSLIDGEAGVLADHSSFTAPVATGILRIKDDKGRWRDAFTTGGILEVKNHKTVLLVDAAEWPEEIDEARARASREAAEADLAGSMFKFEIFNAAEHLKRAKTRLKVRALRKTAEGTSPP